MMFTFNKYEKKDAYVSVKDNHTGGNVTIASATVEIVDLDGVNVKGPSAATLADNGTTTPDVSFLVDGTDLDYDAGTEYEGIFAITIGTRIIHHRKQMLCEAVRY
jgi:hypothetical protein